MFQNYLTRLDHKLSNSRPNGRKILIILDDCSSHRIINLKFNNIRLCYLKNEANHKTLIIQLILESNLIIYP